MKVIVVGSGIAGLSAAIALRKVGLEVVVYERAPMLTEIGAGISLWSNALGALDKIGAGVSIRERLEPLRNSEMRVQEGYTISAAYQAAELEAALGLQPVVGMIHRAELVELLAECVPLSSLRFGCELTEISDSGKKVKVTFANGERDVADFVIGADGIHSKLRSLLLDRTPPRYSGYTCFRGVTALPSSLVPGYLGEWWGHGCRIGITTLRNRRVYWWATVNAPKNTRVKHPRSWLCSQFDCWAEPVPELIATTPENAIFQNDIIDRRPDKNWYRGQCLLIGDAAHPTTPNLGQGGCLAIEDAACLYQLFSNLSQLDEILPAFVKLRYPRTAAVNRDSKRLGAVGQWSGKYACWLRDTFAKRALPMIGVNQILKYARNVDHFLVES